MNVDVLVVGAGFSGTVIAERLANAGRNVLVIDKRQHIGGNAYDTYDDNGILVHKYGPHSFHTKIDRVWNYLSQFTDWRSFELRVLAEVEGKMVPVPFNLDSLHALFPADYASKIESLLTKQYGVNSAIPILQLRSSEDKELRVLSEYIYENIFYHYTKKQWGVGPEELDQSVTARVPVYISRDDRYFQDKYQAMPSKGYTRLFAQMLDHPNIKLDLGVDFMQLKSSVRAEHIVYTGRVDEYYDFCYGKLPYRSITLNWEHIPTQVQFQPVAIVNYPNNHDYTRITEFKHMTGQEHPGTTVVREYPMADGEPYYPVPNPQNAELYKQYEKLAIAEQNVTFVGRLAEYRYYNMDQAIDSALTKADSILGLTHK